jgi:hypothetical protein
MDSVVVVFMKANSHRVGRWMAIAILAVTLSSHAGPAQTESPAAATSAHSPSKKLALEGVGNFGEVTPTLYRGGQPNPVGYENLAKMGVNIVVDARLSGKDKNARK